jgi:hypothetical protein
MKEESKQAVKEGTKATHDMDRVYETHGQRWHENDVLPKH